MSLNVKLVHDKCMTVIRKWAAGTTRQAEAMYAITPLIDMLDGHTEMIDKDQIVAALREESRWFVDSGQTEVAHHLLNFIDKVKEM